MLCALKKKVICYHVIAKTIKQRAKCDKVAALFKAKKSGPVTGLVVRTSKSLNGNDGCHTHKVNLCRKMNNS